MYPLIPLAANLDLLGYLWKIKLLTHTCSRACPRSTHSGARAAQACAHAVSGAKSEPRSKGVAEAKSQPIGGPKSKIVTSDPKRIAAQGEPIGAKSQTVAETQPAAETVCGRQTAHPDPCAGRCGGGSDRARGAGSDPGIILTNPGRGLARATGRISRPGCAAGGASLGLTLFN